MGRDDPGEWIEAERPTATETLVAAGYPEDQALLLARRGIESAAAAEQFLNPSLDQLHPHFALHGMDQAVDRLLEQRGRGGIVVVGDYDVDGVSSTAIMLATLRACGIECEAILPHRKRDGYGLQPQHVERAVERGAELILTLDCGTTAHEPIALARLSGLDVIVVDHHLPGDEELPDAILVNPQQPDCGYPFPELAAAGLAFKLALAVAERAGRDLPVEALLRIACLGTIADMVPLVGENRVIAALGLRALEETRSRGLRALLAEARIEPPYRASDVGYRIGPRLNAVGRVGSADPALELLMTRDDERARQLAGELETSNRDRRDEEARVVSEAESRLEALAELPPILVLWDPDWHRGVVGIAASRLARKYRRPTLLLQVEGERASGSGRSVAGIELFDFLDAWRDRLLRFGGHSQAVGLSVEMEQLEELAAEWREAALVWPEETRQRRYHYELSLTPGQIDQDLWHRLVQLEPYGVGNPQPLVRLGPLRLDPERSPRTFGQDHLRAFVVGRDGRKATLLGWGWQSKRHRLEGEFEALGRLEKDRRYHNLELHLSEVRPVG